MRCKMTEKKWASERELNSERKMHKELHWCSEEGMVIKFGARLTAHWLESHLLPVRPNRVTGSVERYFIEMGVPEDYETYTETGFRRLRQVVEMELAEEDLEVFDEMVTSKGFGDLFKNDVSKMSGLLSAPGASSSGGQDSTANANAVMTAEEIMNLKIKNLKDSLEETIARFNSQNVSLKIIKAKMELGGDAEMMEAFGKAVVACITKTTRLIAMLDKLNAGYEQTNDDQLPKLVELLDAVDVKFDYIVAWSEKFNCTAEPTKKCRKRLNPREPVV